VASVSCVAVPDNAPVGQALRPIDTGDVDSGQRRGCRVQSGDGEARNRLAGGRLSGLRAEGQGAEERVEKLKAFSTACVESVTRTVKLKEPTAVGVPAS